MKAVGVKQQVAIPSLHQSIFAYRKVLNSPPPPTARTTTAPPHPHPPPPPAGTILPPPPPHTSILLYLLLILLDAFLALSNSAQTEEKDCADKLCHRIRFPP
eukprot:566305-Hanusia_phi.AAC.1